jgi:hypothetical protein
MLSAIVLSVMVPLPKVAKASKCNHQEPLRRKNGVKWRPVANVMKLFSFVTDDEA